MRRLEVLRRIALSHVALAAACRRASDAFYAMSMQLDPEDVAYVRQVERTNRKERSR